MNNELILKSTLMLGGNVKVSRGFSHPYADSNGDGTGSFMIGFGNSRIYKTYSEDDGDFELIDDSGTYILTHHGQPFIDGVEMIKRYCHAPNQANVNLGEFDTDEEMMVYLNGLVDTGTVRGITVSIKEGTELETCVHRIRIMHNAYPNIPIGISFRICPRGDLLQIKNAGATEIKINIESTIERICNVLSPNQSVSEYFECLNDSIQIFGKGYVMTSFYVGVGETKNEIEKIFDTLGKMGVLSDIKIKRIDEKTKLKLESEFGVIEPPTVEELSRIGMMLKESEIKYDLDSNNTKTLCIACRGCNLVPFVEY